MNQETFYRALSQLTDGDISPALFQELEQHLLESEEARHKYREFIHIQSLIACEINVQQPKNVVPVDRIIRRQKHRSFRIAVMAAAALLLLGLITMRLFLVAEREPTLAFETSPGTQFSITHRSNGDAPVGQTMEIGSRLQLSQGIVELTFGSGVKSIVVAPADITLHEDDTLFMNQGTAWFEVPEKAIGFTVKTKDLNVVDLGTEFGVLAKPKDYDEIHVFKGKVRVSALGLRKESTLLVANEARRNDLIGRLDTITAKPTAFRRSLSELPPYLHWSFDENDRFAVKGSHPAAKEIVTTPSPADSPPQLVEGKYGSALSLNGEQQSIVTNWDGLYGEDRPLSSALWVRIPEGLDLTNFPGALGWGIPGNSDAKWKVFVRQERRGEAATACIAIGTASGMYRYSGITRLDDNQWHHIAVVRHGRQPESDEPDITLFIDGKPESTTLTRFPVEEGLNSRGEIKRHPLTKPFAIGKGPVPQEVTFRGLIDELYIFDGELTQEEIKQLISN